jgi:hypothetical protein
LRLRFLKRDEGRWRRHFGSVVVVDTGSGGGCRGMFGGGRDRGGEDSGVESAGLVCRRRSTHIPFLKISLQHLDTYVVENKNCRLYPAVLCKTGRCPVARRTRTKVNKQLPQAQRLGFIMSQHSPAEKYRQHSLQDSEEEAEANVE